MHRPKEIVVGSRGRFAVRFGFLPDPDDGRRATVEHELSWGCLEVWVNGRNLCEHLELGEPISAVHWYLLPLLEWFASNWDFLFHEERLPARNAAGNAWASLVKTVEPPAAYSEAEAERWEEQWQRWWLRHCLLACREGGLFPNVIVRRWQDLVEISWGEDRLAGCPAHFQFGLEPGYARLEPDEVARTLHEALSDASRHLISQKPDSPRFQRLAQDIENLANSSHRRRLELLAGVRADDGEPDARGVTLESRFPSDLSREISNAILGAEKSQLVIHGSSQAALMFGSVSPTIQEEDTRLLAAKLVDLFSPSGDSVRLKQMCRNEPLPGSDENAWRQGYDLADSILEALSMPTAADEWIDVEAIYDKLDIKIEEIELQDASIRAVAIAGPKHQPAVLINRKHTFPEPVRRRFTLAHELCHILHDRSYGAQLAMASGPWAPMDIEQRANAFAAMLLMPESLVAVVVKALDEPISTERSIWAVANSLRTSFTSTLDHLCNLGYLDNETRQCVRERVDANSAVARPTTIPK